MTWLWNSMEPKISANFMFLDTAKDIWEHAKKLYSRQDNTTRVYQLYQEYFDLQQGNKTLEEYYANMKNLINELNVYHPLTLDVKVQQQQREQLDVTRFLVGLKSEYEPVRPKFWEVLLFLHLRKYLQRLRRISLGSIESTTLSDRSGFVVARGGGRGNRGGGHGSRGGCGGSIFGRGGGCDSRGDRGKGKGNSTRKCTHCGKEGHSANFCYNLHGPPSTWENHAAAGGVDVSDNQQPYLTPSTSTFISKKEMMSVPRDEYERFLQTTSQHTTATIAHSDIACLASKPSPWIIYSRASDHMTGTPGSQD
ncbi:PREDICTED: rRNA 2'-O-methyltransferase fibrillarin-like isoform X1 [Nelumbo nucifera]|uniref:rRNA 2'-O-methyltransferase fibrillarin-like isoform X1 n=1 Tax=Nelumbo nucifera TaxID=4432 RepID=A0A1U7ZKF8_NELNU|nr:PREDICTED: rRNA 2'-O-methyltransferase fibrillarin-like isoform X1 [Nelumbo nucifera]